MSTPAARADAPAARADAPAAATSSGLALAGWVLLCVGSGTLVGLTSDGGQSTWYQALRTPAWNPPAWVFAPVWTTLYALMGVSAWLVWRHGGWARQRLALTVFLAQLVANLVWSPIFFDAQMPGLALADLLLLWGLAVVTIRRFSQVDRRAAWLLAPYLAWLTYAATLNAGVVVMN